MSGLQNNLGYPGYIFEQEYVAGVLGIQIPLNEAAPYSDSYRQQIIQEHMLLEAFFSDFKKLTGDTKNAALALRYIMQDASRISDYTSLVMQDLNESYEKLKSFLETVTQSLSSIVKQYSNDKIKSALSWSEGMLSKINTLYEASKGVNGWKGAMMVSGALVGIGYVWSLFKGSSKAIVAALSKAKDYVDSKMSEAVNLLNPSLAALYEASNDSFLVIEGLPDNVKSKINDALGALKDQIKAVGPKVAQALAVKAISGVLTGGVATAFNALYSLFGGAKKVFKFLGSPLEKFVSKIKNPEKEEKEAEKGIDDPTSSSKNESYEFKDTVKTLLAEFKGIENATVA